jgi:transcriptional regulator GlxA family with amidase domain
MKIAMLMYDNMTALDLIGPYEVFRFLPGATLHMVSKRPGLVRTDAGLQLLNSEFAFADISQPDILFIPGSTDNTHVMQDKETLAWVREAHSSSKWTTSVCTGSLILGAAGLLRSVRSTTHWAALDILERLGAQVVTERVVHDGKILTGAGVSAGIDLALTLAALEFEETLAKSIQLSIEYDPQPPFDAGSSQTAPSDIVRAVRARFRPT